VVLLPIADRHLTYAREVEARLSKAGIRAQVDDRSEKLGFKVREAEVHKIPVMLVVGDAEAESGTVTPRRRQTAEQSQKAVAVDALVAELSNENELRQAARTA
jgi:threonyl-tRNA synthetase